MHDLVDCVIEDERWATAGLPALAERAARAALSDRGLDPERFGIALLACDDARIAVLNAAFRARNGATNVLSWPSCERAPQRPGAMPAPPPAGMAGDPCELGDIAIAYDTCAAEARAQGKTLADHASHLVVHAVLHLLGHDHEHEADAALMEECERRILASMGIADPY